MGSEFTDALIIKGHEIGDLNEHSFHSIQLQIMELLKDLIKRYTQGDSTSIKVEVAERILSSIHYVMDLYISSLPAYDEQITYLKTKGIRLLYQQGLRYIRALVKETKELFSELDKHMLNVPNEVYTDTFDKAIPDFFKHYDIYFNAQDIACSIDYPLIFDDMSLQGITYIKNYLTTLKVETDFCHFFPIDDITTLLIDYCKKHRIDMINAPINLFELTFGNALFSFLSDDSQIHLTLSRPQFERVSQVLTSLPPAEVPAFIERAIHQLMNYLVIGQPALMEYIKRYQSLFIPRIINSLVNDTLYNIPIIKKSNQDQLFFEKGDMMADETFREVVEELLECMDSQQKLAILADKVHSIEDFIDILAADCLFGSEVRDAFKILTTMELAVLALIVFNEDLSADFSLDLSLIDKRLEECETPWQQEFLQFIQDLDSDLLHALENIIIKMA